MDPALCFAGWHEIVFTQCSHSRPRRGRCQLDSHQKFANLGKVLRDVLVLSKRRVSMPMACCAAPFPWHFPNGAHRQKVPENAALYRHCCVLKGGAVERYEHAISVRTQHPYVRFKPIKVFSEASSSSILNLTGEVATDGLNRPETQNLRHGFWASMSQPSHRYLRHWQAAFFLCGSAINDVRARWRSPSPPAGAFVLFERRKHGGHLFSMSE